MKIFDKALNYLFRRHTTMCDDTENPLPKGVKILHDPVRNKGTAFTEAERQMLGLRGLLPPRIHSIAEQEQRVLGNVRAKVSNLERYLFLIALQDRNETLFYRVLTNNIEEMMPLVYTPTVGQACEMFGHIYRRSRGLYVSMHDRGNVADILANWPHKDVRVIVVTDGERILGLGDLGANGMGIPVGKLSLYTACAGIAPQHCLPITIDVGTNNDALLNDQLYNGLEQRRVRGQDYDSLIEEFIEAARQQFPGVLIQLEDFGNANAFDLLARYRDRTCLFDDDIQGTGAVGLSGLLSALRITGGKLEDQRILFYGAGQASIGIGDTLVAALRSQGVTERQARQCCWYVDTQGLVVKERDGLAQQKQAYAHQHRHLASLQDAVDVLRPTVLIGASGQSGAFTEPVLRSMARYNNRPVIFALSNPTAKAECSAEQCYQWTGGAGIFASGSPFAAVEYGGQRFVPGQGNNAYIFPGVGLGVIASHSSRVTDEMFLAAAYRLAAQVSQEDLAVGRLYPALKKIREVSVDIACEVARIAWESGVAGKPEPDDIPGAIKAELFEAIYPHYA
jgi:malate dehydrogenase (oxaloacetate-decarboxylating)(NADP+)